LKDIDAEYGNDPENLEFWQKAHYDKSMILNEKKFATLLLLLGVAAFSYSEGFYSFDSGLNFFTERYRRESYSRRQIAWNVGASGAYYPADSSMGIFVRSVIASNLIWEESNPRETMLPRQSNVFEWRLMLAPSIRLLGYRVQVPLSLGPSFVFNNEESTERAYSTDSQSSGSTSKGYKYQALSLGISADATVNYVLKGGFIIKQGLSLDYIFLRSEKGEMRMNYRTTHNKKYQTTPYHALGFGFYFGMGHQF
jgi:hypothetical protein